MLKDNRSNYNLKYQRLILVILSALTSLICLLLAISVSNADAFSDSNISDLPDISVNDSMIFKNGIILKIYRGKIGAINEQGKWVISPQYDNMQLPSSDGEMLVEKNGKWALIDKKGKQLTDFIYDEAYPFSEDNYAAIKTGDKFLFLNIKGEKKEFYKNPMTDILNFNPDGSVHALHNDKYVLILPEFDTWYPHNEEYEKYSPYISHESEWTMTSYDIDGIHHAVNLYYNQQEVGVASSDQNTFEDAKLPDDGSLAAVRNFSKKSDGSTNWEKGKWGYLDHKFEIVIPCKYDEAYPFAGNGLALAAIDGFFGFIDMKGNWVIDPQYKGAVSFNDFSNLTAVEKDGLWGFIDKDNQFIIQPRFETASGFESNGLAKVTLNGVETLIDTFGTTLLDTENTSHSNNSSIVPNKNETGESGKVKPPEHTENVISSKDINLEHFIFTEGLAIRIQNGKAGYIDKTGFFVILPQFDNAAPFGKNGLAPVEKDKHWGFIDKSGNWVIQPILEDKTFFSKNGLAVGKINNLFGYIDETGKWVILAKYKKAESFAENGLALVEENGKYNYIHTDGTNAFEQEYGKNSQSFFDTGTALIEIDEKFGLIDSSGKELIKPQFDQFLLNPKPDNYIFVKKGNYWGILKKDGKWAVSPQYQEIGYFASNGLAPAKISNKWGYINDHGTWIISYKFDDAQPFSDNGLALVMTQKTGIQWIDEKGNIIISPADFIIGNAFASNGLALIAKDKNAYGFINEKGEFAFPALFQEVHGYTDNGLAAAKKSRKWGFIDSKGEWVIDPQFEDVQNFDVNGIACILRNNKWYNIDPAGNITDLEYPVTDPTSDALAFSNGLAPLVDNNGLVGFIDTTGYFAIEPIYQSVKSFGDNGLVPVKKDGTWDYIDKTGKEITTERFTFAASFENYHFASIEKNNRFGLIDENGQYIVQPEYKGIGEIQSNGFIKVITDQGYGFINTKGEVVIEPKYAALGEFIEGESIIPACEQRGKCGFLDDKGNWVIQPIFESVTPFNGRKAAGAKEPDGNWGLIDQNGLWILKPKYDSISIFDSVGMAVACTNTGCGWIDETGKIIIATNYLALGGFTENGLAFAKRGNVYGYIDRKGMWKIQPTFSYASGFADNGLALAVTTKGIIFIDQKGRTKIDLGEGFYADNVGNFLSCGLAPVHSALGNGWGFINSEGALVIGLEYDEKFNYDENTHLLTLSEGGNTFQADCIGNVSKVTN